MLQIANNLSLPLSFLTETAAILAKKRSGKTYAAKALSEDMVRAGGQVVALDPLGVWWGLRAGANGEADGGLPVLLFGGDHADLPLLPHQGRAVAEMLVAERLPAVLDLSHLPRRTWSEFVTPFLETLFERSKSPLHLMVDEADAFAPQTPGSKGEAAMLDALDNLVRRGGVRGLGVTLISQRPAVLNKDVLTQIEALFMLRVTAPADQKALDNWIAAHGTTEERKAVMTSLATLAIGEAWVWAPNLLGELKRVQIRRLTTFDTSATPKMGESVKEPRSLASLDLSALRERFASEVAQAEESDLAALRAKIRQLEQALSERRREVVTVEVERVVERLVPVIGADTLRRAHSLCDALTASGKDMLGAANEIKAALSRIDTGEVRVIEAVETKAEMTPAAPLLVKPAPEPKPVDKTVAPTTVVAPTVSSPSPSTPAGTGEVTEAGQAILNALGAFRALGLIEVARENVAVWAGYSHKGGAYHEHVRALLRAGLVEYPKPGLLALTAAGLKSAEGSDKPLKTTEELQAAWLARLPGTQRAALKELIAVYPASLPREEVAERLGQSAKGGAFLQHLRDLKNLGVASYPKPGRVAATALLFPEKS